MKKRYPSQVADRFLVRLPEGMRDLIRQLADENERSMNSELIFWLKKGLDSSTTQQRGQ